MSTSVYCQIRLGERARGTRTVLYDAMPTLSPEVPTPPSFSKFGVPVPRYPVPKCPGPRLPGSTDPALHPSFSSSRSAEVLLEFRCSGVLEFCDSGRSRLRLRPVPVPSRTVNTPLRIAVARPSTGTGTGTSASTSSRVQCGPVGAPEMKCSRAVGFGFILRLRLRLRSLCACACACGCAERGSRGSPSRTLRSGGPHARTHA